MFKAGIEDTKVFFEDAGRKKGAVGFLFPGIAFAMCVFPYQATELSEKYIELSRSGLNNIFRAIGWGIIVVLVVRYLIIKV